MHLRGACEPRRPFQPPAPPSPGASFPCLSPLSPPVSPYNPPKWFKSSLELDVFSWPDVEFGGLIAGWHPLGGRRRFFTADDGDRDAGVLSAAGGVSYLRRPAGGELVFLVRHGVAGAVAGFTGRRQGGMAAPG